MTDFPKHVQDAASHRYDEILRAYQEREWEHSLTEPNPYSEFCLLFADVLHLQGNPAEVLDQARANADWRKKSQESRFGGYGSGYGDLFPGWPVCWGGAHNPAR